MTLKDTNRTFALIVLIAMGAFFLRLPGLDKRPMHGDEANQAFKTGILLEQGSYTYDPHDHHGPTLYYLTLLPAFLTGQYSFEDTTEITYRIVPVFFGAALILLSLLLRPALPSTALITSALLIALSPAFVFYSRYYIQETLLVFFTLAAIGTGYQYLRAPSLKLAIAFGGSLSLMHATKETAIIAYFAMALSLALVYLQHRNTEACKRIINSITRKHMTAFIITAATINILLYTAFFTNLRGPLDSILTYGNYLQRAGGAGLHDKPWHYYLNLLVYTNKGPGYWFSEAFPLILAIGAVFLTIAKSARKESHPLALFLTVYSLAMLAAYSVIPYKTPWSVLSLYHAAILLAGIAAAQLFTTFKSLPARSILSLLLTAGLAHFAWQSYITNHVIPADPRNPYVYAHTSSAHLQLVQRVHDIRAVHPAPESMRIHIIQPDHDYWPLPWYLRGIEHVGYFDSVPDTPDADIIIVAPSTREALAEELQGEYTKETGGLRPSVLRDVYIKRSLWDEFMKTRQ